VVGSKGCPTKGEKGERAEMGGYEGGVIKRGETKGEEVVSSVFGIITRKGKQNMIWS